MSKRNKFFRIVKTIIVSSISGLIIRYSDYIWETASEFLKNTII